MEFILNNWLLFLSITGGLISWGLLSLVKERNGDKKKEEVNFTYDKEELMKIASNSFFCNNVEVEFGMHQSILKVKLFILNEGISLSQINNFYNSTKNIVPYYSNVLKEFTGMMPTQQGLVLSFSLKI